MFVAISESATIGPLRDLRGIERSTMVGGVDVREGVLDEFFIDLLSDFDCLALKSFLAALEWRARLGLGSIVVVGVYLSGAMVRGFVYFVIN